MKLYSTSEVTKLCKFFPSNLPSNPTHPFLSPLPLTVSPSLPHRSTPAPILPPILPPAGIPPDGFTFLRQLQRVRHEAVDIFKRLQNDLM